MCEITIFNLQHNLLKFIALWAFFFLSIIEVFPQAPTIRDWQSDFKIETIVDRINATSNPINAAKLIDHAINNHKWVDAIIGLKTFRKKYPVFLKESFYDKQFQTLYKKLLFKYINVQSWLETINTFEDMNNDGYSVSEYIRKVIKEVYITYAGQKIQKQEWTHAINIYEKMSRQFPEDSSRNNTIIKILEAPLNPLIEVSNLGNNVNSKYSDYYPIISSLGNKIYFLRNNTEKCPKDTANQMYYICRLLSSGEDIWVSEKINGIWQKAYKDTSLSTQKNEAILALFNNDTEAILFVNGELRKARYMNGSWCCIEKSEEFDNIHFDWIADLCFSKDHNYLFLAASNKKSGDDGKSNVDIYICEWKESSQIWSKPVNLGKKINTGKSERTPFLCGDGRTLYFSSYGHPGLGGLDIFRSYKTGPNPSDWSTPENLGKQINSSSTDWGFKLPAFNDIGFFSSIRKISSPSDKDIYSVKLPENLRCGESIAACRGLVLDDNRNTIQTSLIIKYDTLIRRRIKQKSMTTTDNKPDGSFYLNFKIGKKYHVEAQTNDPRLISSSIDIDLRNKDSLNNLDFIIHRQNIVLSRCNINLNIIFEYSKADILPDSHYELSRLINFMKQNKGLNITIVGHTDSSGTHHKLLSNRRAESVKKYLLKHGIPRKQIISTLGKGCSKPLSRFRNENIEDYNRRNRRVEIKFHCK